MTPRVPLFPGEHRGAKPSFCLEAFEALVREAHPDRPVCRKDVMRVVVAMSGGVDSSVAAALLKEQGHEVIGIMLRLWSEPGVIEAEDDGVERVVQNKCCSLESVDDARRVARMLDIPFYLVNVEQEFKQRIVDT